MRTLRTFDANNPLRAEATPWPICLEMGLHTSSVPRACLICSPIAVDALVPYPSFLPPLFMHTHTCRAIKATLSSMLTSVPGCPPHITQCLAEAQRANSFIKRYIFII